MAECVEQKVNTKNSYNKRLKSFMNVDRLWNFNEIQEKYYCFS